MFIEVESVLLSILKLQEVVVEGLLRYLDMLGSLVVLRLQLTGKDELRIDSMTRTVAKQQNKNEGDVFIHSWLRGKFFFDRDKMHDKTHTHTHNHQVTCER